MLATLSRDPLPVSEMAGFYTVAMAFAKKATRCHKMLQILYRPVAALKLKQDELSLKCCVLRATAKPLEVVVERMLITLLCTNISHPPINSFPGSNLLAVSLIVWFNFAVAKTTTRGLSCLLQSRSRTSNNKKRELFVLQKNTDADV